MVEVNVDITVGVDAYLRLVQPILEGFSVAVVVASIITDGSGHFICDS